MDSEMQRKVGKFIFVQLKTVNFKKTINTLCPVNYDQCEVLHTLLHNSDVELT